MQPSLIPVLLGLATGIAFMLALAYSIDYFNIRQPPASGQSQGFELKAVEQNLPELKLFLSKYNSSEMNIYFGRSQNGTLEFNYELGRWIDKDGDGYKDANRRLELSFSYDESGGHELTDAGNYDPARVKQIEIRCREQVASTPDIDKAFADIMSPAHDGQVEDFIENVNCLS